MPRAALINAPRRPGCSPRPTALSQKSIPSFGRPAARYCRPTNWMMRVSCFSSRPPWPTSHAFSASASAYHCAQAKRVRCRGCNRILRDRSSSRFCRFCVGGLFALRDLCGIRLLAVEDRRDVRDRARWRDEAGSHHAAFAFERCFLFLVLRRGGRGLGCCAAIRCSSLITQARTAGDRLLRHSSSMSGGRPCRPERLDGPRFCRQDNDLFVSRGLCRRAPATKQTKRTAVVFLRLTIAPPPAEIAVTRFSPNCRQSTSFRHRPRIAARVSGAVLAFL